MANCWECDSRVRFRPGLPEFVRFQNPPTRHKRQLAAETENGKLGQGGLLIAINMNKRQQRLAV